MLAADARAEPGAASPTEALLNAVHFKMGVLRPPAPACLLPENPQEDELPYEPLSREELLKQRSSDEFSECLERAAGEQSTLVSRAGWSFARAIELSVAEGMKSRPTAGLMDDSQLVQPKGPYPLPKVEDRTAVSLVSLPLCVPRELDHLGGVRGRSTETLAAAARFASHENRLRSEPDPIARSQHLRDFWIRNFACLASAESLGDPDNPASSSFIKGMARQGIRDLEKPEGVKFYFDVWQTEAISKLNIGLYQFSPSADGNIRPCLEEWNLRMKHITAGVDRPGPLRGFTKSCVIDTTDKQQVFRALSSSSQAFNAFCGVQKVVGTFLIQANTARESSTSGMNVVGTKKGVLRDPADRCVSPHLKSGHVYNHFGVLQGTTKDNLKKFLECALPDTDPK
jgi:hypothetical protein